MSKPNPDEEIVRLAKALNPQEAYVWCDALEEEGIQCKVVGDNLEAGLGDFGGLLPEVWVHQKDLERARAILEAHFPRPMTATEQPEMEEDA